MRLNRDNLIKIEDSVDISDKKELVGFHEKFEDVKMEDFIDCQADVEGVNKLIDMIITRQYTVVGHYIVSHYVKLYNSICSITPKRQKLDGKSRQYIVKLNKEHCFQYIQYIRRDETLNIVINMRSCDIINNFTNDMLLIYLMTKNRYLYDKINIIVNIGSLHIVS